MSTITGSLTNQSVDPLVEKQFCFPQRHLYLTWRRSLFLSCGGQRCGWLDMYIREHMCVHGEHVCTQCVYRSGTTWGAEPQMPPSLSMTESLIGLEIHQFDQASWPWAARDLFVSTFHLVLLGHRHEWYQPWLFTWVLNADPHGCEAGIYDSPAWKTYFSISIIFKELCKFDII